MEGNEVPHIGNKEKLNLTFRRATAEDVDDCLALERTTIGNNMYSHYSEPEEILKELSAAEVYLIYKDGQLVGSTAMVRKSPDHVYLSGVVVHPDFQGQGIAREATLFRLNQLKGVKRIDTVTHPENTKIINLYQSLGFKIESRVENYYGDGEPRLILAREEN